MAQIPVVVFTPIAKTVMNMMAAMFMVMAVKKETTIVRAMKRVVTILTQIGGQIITMILLIIARATRYGNAGFYMIYTAITALAQIIRAG
jgi:hypothetical protein